MSECEKCHGTGKVTCSRCDGKKKVKCTDCDGKGKKTCQKCSGSGQITCVFCHGKKLKPCSVCSGRGWDWETRYVKCSRCHGTGISSYGRDGSISCRACGGSGQKKENFREKCPNCHGTGSDPAHKICGHCDGTGHHNCYECSGKGEIECSSCSGAGIITCRNCHGTGEERCPECEARKRRKKSSEVSTSPKKRWKFVVLGILLGFFGIHLAYAKRWLLFLLLWGGFIAGNVMSGGSSKPEQDTANVPQATQTENQGKKGGSPIGGIGFAVWALLWIGGTLFIKKDGKGNRM